VATNVDLDKEKASVLAMMAATGLARAVRPVHTIVDGDTVFALAAGEAACDINALGAVAADVLARAVADAVLRAEPLGGLPSAGSLRTGIIGG
jgi:L-aminopeptidase/D-esterase-like protein